MSPEDTMPFWWLSAVAAMRNRDKDETDPPYVALAVLGMAIALGFLLFALLG